MIVGTRWILLYYQMVVKLYLQLYSARFQCLGWGIREVLYCHCVLHTKRPLPEESGWREYRLWTVPSRMPSRHWRFLAQDTKHTERRCKTLQPEDCMTDRPCSRRPAPYGPTKLYHYFTFTQSTLAFTLSHMTNPGCPGMSSQGLVKDVIFTWKQDLGISTVAACFIQPAKKKHIDSRGIIAA